MRQKVSKLRLLLLSLLAIVVFATATAFIGVNYGDKIFASADVAPLTYDENGVAIVEDEDGSKGYFNITTNGDTVTMVGFTSGLYRLLGADVDLVANITVPFKLIVPSKVTNIQMTVANNSTIQGLEFPDNSNIKVMNDWTLSNTTGVTELCLPATVTTIKANSFGSKNLKTIKFKDSTGAIVDRNTAGTLVTVNDGEAILADSGKTLFWGSAAAAEKLTTDAAYADINKFGSQAFFNRLGIDSITIPSRITELDSTVFAESGIKTITADGENTVYTIENNAIVQKSDSALVCIAGGTDGNAVVPEGVKSVLDNAISISTIINLSFPASIESIASVHCVNRMDISIADGNAKFYSKHPVTGEQLHCLIEKTDEGDVLKIGAGLTDLTKLPESVYAIGKSAFFGCRTLTSVTIPENITELRNEAFRLSGLTKITIHDNLTFTGTNHFGSTPYYSDPVNWDNGQIFYIGDILVSVTNSLTGDYSVRKGTKSLLGNAFNGCNAITKVTLPEGLESINSTSFQNCTSLTSINLPDSVNFVASSVFNGCTALTQISLPNNTKTVYATKTFAGTSAKMVAPGYEVYQNVVAQVTTNKANLTYETPVTVNVGQTSITQTKLANHGLGYTKVNGVWTEGTTFDAGVDLSEVSYWTVNGGETHYTTAELAAYKVPADGSAVTLTAYKADDTTEIEPTLVKPAAADASFKYGESEKFNPEEAFVGFFFSTMKITYTGADNVESEQVPFETGTYTVKIYPMTANWSDTSDSSAYEIGTLTVNPTDAQIVWTGVGGSESDFEYVYDAKAHKPSAYFIDAHGDKILLDSYISLAEGDGTKASGYTAKLTFADGDFANYEIKGSLEKQFTVAKREIVVTWDTETAFDFTSFEVSPEVSWTTDFNDGAFEVVYALSAKEGSELTSGKAVKPGDYVITLSITGNENYVINADSLTYEFTINPPDASTIYWESDTESGTFEYDYDGEIKLPKAYYINAVDNTKVYLDEGVLGGAYGAGVHTAKISQWVLAKYNLTGQTECEFKILKKKVNIEWDSELSFVYNGKLQKPVAYITGVNGERIMLDVKVAEGEGIDAGSYTATIGKTDFANYEVTGGDTQKAFTIEKKTVAAVWSGSEFTFDGTEQTASYSIEGYDGEAAVDYYTLAGEKLDGAPVDVGTYVAKLTLADGNYQLENNSFAFSIKSDAEVLTENGGANWLVIGLCTGIGLALIIGIAAMIVALTKRRKAVEVVSDDDGNNKDEDGFYDIVE